MDLLALTAFLNVIEQKSFSSAAGHLHVTQPAISKRIAALEEELGTALFNRIGRQATLTEAGHALQPYARRILADMEAGRIAVQNLSKVIGGTIALGVSQHISLHRIPALLKKFKKDYPQVELDIDFLESEETCLAVEQGKEEIALITLPLATPPVLSAQPIWLDTLAIVTSKDHALAAMKKVTLRDLQKHPAILPGRGTFTRELIEKQFSKSGSSPLVGMETNNFETIRMMASIGLGWTALPDTMINSSFKTFSIPGLQLQRRLGYVVHAKRALSNAACALIKMLEQAGPPTVS